MREWKKSAPAHPGLDGRDTIRQRYHTGHGKARASAAGGGEAFSSFKGIIHAWIGKNRAFGMHIMAGKCYGQARDTGSRHVESGIIGMNENIGA